MNVKKIALEIINSNPDQHQLDQYLYDVRDSLSSTNRQFISYQFLLLFTLALYHLVVHEGWQDLSIGSVKIADRSLFDQVFLVVPAGIFLMLSAMGYLRLLQREVYDYLAISRLQVLAKTGVHELRLPSNYILGLNILRNEAGIVQRIISYVAAGILSFIFLLAPATYMCIEAISNLKQYGNTDPITIVVLILVSLSFLSGLLIMTVAARVDG